jgi:hypothetical protein
MNQIGNYAFFGCTGLTSLALGSGVQFINMGAFSGCTELTGIVTVPYSIQMIDEEAFAGCTKVSLFQIPSDLPQGIFYRIDSFPPGVGLQTY